MRIALRVNWILVTLLSIATGVFKILQQPADIDLFKVIGLNVVMLTILGIIQLIGGILLVPARTRKLGAYIMIPTFVIAAIAVFANKLIPFGIVSLLFIVMAYLVAFMENNKSIYNE